MSKVTVTQTSLRFEPDKARHSSPFTATSAAKASRMANRLKRLVAGTFCVLFFVSTGWAADSTCLLGDNGKIAVTTFEHRTSTGGRATDVTLIFGTHLLRGELVDVDSGPVTLKATGKGKENNYIFTGTINVDYDGKKMTLKGKLKVDGTEISNFNTTFRCKQLQP
jgi:hypothetical protein